MSTCLVPGTAGGVSQKRCPACRLTWPATAEFFHRHRGRRDGLRETCILCRRRLRHDAALRERTKAQRGSLLMLFRAIRAGCAVPRARELCEAAYAEFGGPVGVAVLARAVFDAAPAGGRTQASIIATVLQMQARMQRPESDDLDDEEPPPDDLSRLSDGELEALVGALSRARAVETVG